MRPEILGDEISAETPRPYRCQWSGCFLFGQLDGNMNKAIAERLHRAYYSMVEPQGEVTERAHGPDVSKYDLRFDPAQASAQLDFVIQRVSYRTTRDEAFEALLPGVMAVPIRGGYHYLNSDKTWQEQADKYLSFVNGYEYHFHACDFEDAFNTMSLDLAYGAWRWIHYVQDRTGAPVLLYTSPSLYHDWIYPSQSRFGINWNNVDLWTAQWFYTPSPDGYPSTPAGRTAGWKLWQYTAKANGTYYGLGRSTACDLNVFNGSVQELARFLNMEAIMATQWYQVNTTTLNIRGGAGTNFSDIGDLFKGDKVETDQYIGGWVRIKKILRVDGREEVKDNAWCSTAYCFKIDPPVVTPPPTPEPQPAVVPLTITIGGDGYETKTITLNPA